MRSLFDITHIMLQPRMPHINYRLLATIPWSPQPRSNPQGRIYHSFLNRKGKVTSRLEFLYLSSWKNHLDKVHRMLPCKKCKSTYVFRRCAQVSPRQGLRGSNDIICGPRGVYGQSSPCDRHGFVMTEPVQLSSEVYRTIITV